MPLSAAPSSRTRKHNRSVRFDGRKPFRLDCSAALDTGGDAIRPYTPRWQREAETGAD